MNISKRMFQILLFMLIISIVVVSASAGSSQINDVTRTLPDTVDSETEFLVILEIDSQESSVAGILETIPDGFTFPSSDEGICTSCDFIVDRNKGTIAFSAIDVEEIRYNLISSSSATVYTFSGDWVDLLYQDTTLDESDERWESVTGDLAIEVVAESNSNSDGSSSSKKSGSSGSSGTSFQVVDSESEDEEEATDSNETTMKSVTDAPEEDLSSEDTSSDSDMSAEESATGSEPATESSAQTPGFCSVAFLISGILAVMVITRRQKR